MPGSPPTHRAPADVAAAEAFGPVDQVDRLIGALLSPGDVGPQRGDAQHDHARVQIAIPKKLTSKERKLFTELQRVSRLRPRGG